jgi:hypothetical protein
MSKRITSAVVALACALAVSVGSASASGGADSTISFRVQNVGLAACEDALFGLSFDMVSLDGEPLGTGISCVQSFRGCADEAGCRGKLEATMTFDFARGSVTAAVLLREVWLTDASLVQRAKGRIVGGTGAFAGARGRVAGGGTVSFETGELDLVYVIRLKDDDGDD